MESKTLNSLIEYGGFKVNLKEVNKLFNLICKFPNYGFIELGIESGLGKNKIENYRYYLRDFGLLAGANYKLTDLGRLLFTYQKNFTEEFTFWLLLYEWAKSEGNPFLYYYLNYGGNERGKSEMEIEFVYWASQNGFKTDYETIVGGLINRTITALTDSDAFQSLNLFTIHDDRLYRSEPYNVHPLLVAYILYDNRRNRVSTSINELLEEPGNIGKFFGYNSRTLDAQLVALQELNLVKRVQTADLNMINYLYTGTPLALAERYYNENL